MKCDAERSAGILLPIFSLPSRFGIGCFSQEAYRFVDWLAEAGQRNWQILPLGITGYGDSPYQSFSAFAGNPYFISLEGLLEDGYLTEEECESADLEGNSADRVDYGRQYVRRYPLLRRAYERARQNPAENREEWVADNRDWLEDYTLFMALKEEFGGKPLAQWSEPFRLRFSDALAEARQSLSDLIGFHEFLQERFYREWMQLKRYANQKGIRMVGDLPIYVSADSADVWANPELFLLDENRNLTEKAGCPPDSFAPQGQLWGNPLYRWSVHAADGYRWWTRRLAYAFSLYDAVRIDHFRGLDSYYSVPAQATTAERGHWEAGPGMALFDAVKKAIGTQDGIAEDLGFITDSVRRLVRESGFASMKVFQLGWEENDAEENSEHLPHRYDAHCVAYTGTHDQPTLKEWLNESSRKREERLRSYLNAGDSSDTELCETIIAALMNSSAERCIIPIQDYLEIGKEGRINRPSSLENNWQWRMMPDALSQELCFRVRNLTRLGNRCR